MNTKEYLPNLKMLYHLGFPPCPQSQAKLSKNELGDRKMLIALNPVALPLKYVFITQSCPTLCNAMECNPPGSSVHGFLQTRILEWVAISFSMPLK